MLTSSSCASRWTAKPGQLQVWTSVHNQTQRALIQTSKSHRHLDEWQSTTGESNSRLHSYFTTSASGLLVVTETNMKLNSLYRVRERMDVHLLDNDPKHGIQQSPDLDPQMLERRHGRRPHQMFSAFKEKWSWIPPERRSDLNQNHWKLKGLTYFFLQRYEKNNKRNVEFTCYSLKCAICPQLWLKMNELIPKSSRFLITHDAAGTWRGHLLSERSSKGMSVTSFGLQCSVKSCLNGTGGKNTERYQQH